MKIPSWAAAILLSAAVSLSGWTLIEVISLKVTVAGLVARVDNLTGTKIASK
jgi:hypothetical protein